MGGEHTGRSRLREQARPVGEAVWEIPQSAKPGMRVPARIFATAELMAQMDDGVFEQVTNVAMLPGIVGHAFCMPDGHWGYGFPIGGRGGHGPGARRHLARRHRLRHQLRHAPGAHQPRPSTRCATASASWSTRCSRRVPAGVGARGFVKLSDDEFRDVAEQGLALVRRTAAMAGPRTWSAPRRAARFAGADPERSARGPSSAAATRSAPWARATTICEIQVAKPENIFDRRGRRSRSASPARTRW